ncbi:MAG: oligosaccharide flippase family protein [Pseudomonadota bacterium]
MSEQTGEQSMVGYAPTSTRTDSVARNLLLANSANYLEYFIGLIVSLLIARSLGPSDYGIYVFMIWMVSIAVAVTNEGFNLSVTKHVAEDSQDDNRPSISLIVQFFERAHLTRLLIFMLPLALATWLNSVERGTAFTAFAVSALCACFFFRARHMLRVSTFRGMEKFWGVAIAPFVMTPLNLASAIVLYLWGAPIWAYLVQYLVISAGFYLCTRFFLLRRSGYVAPALRHGRFMGYFDKVGEYNRYVGPSAILAYIMASQTEVLFLNLFSSTEVVAFFNVGFVLAGAIATLVPGIINMVLLPMVSRSMAKGIDVVRGIVEQTLRYQLYLNFLVLGPTYLYAETVVVFLFGEEYRAASVPFFWLVVIYCGANFVSAFNSYLLAANEHRLLLRVSIWGAVFGLLCDLVLVYLFDLSGAIWALGLTMFWYVTARIVPANRRLRAVLRPLHLLLTIAFCVLATVLAATASAGTSGVLGAVLGTLLYVLVFSACFYVSPVLPAQGRDYLRGVLSR